MSIELYPSIAKIKRNGVYENLPGFVPETGSIATQQMIATSESSATAQYVHNKGEYFRLNDTLYQAIVKINVGDAIVVGTNCEVAVIGNDLTHVANSIAPYELGIATSSHNTGDYFMVGETLYVATADIQAGDTISTSTNCRKAVVGDELSGLKTAIPNYIYPLSDFGSGWERTTYGATITRIGNEISISGTRTSTYRTYSILGDSCVVSSDQRESSLSASAFGFETGKLAPNTLYYFCLEITGVGSGGTLYYCGIKGIDEDSNITSISQSKTISLTKIGSYKTPFYYKSGTKLAFTFQLRSGTFTGAKFKVWFEKAEQDAIASPTPPFENVAPYMGKWGSGYFTSTGSVHAVTANAEKYSIDYIPLCDSKVTMMQTWVDSSLVGTQWFGIAFYNQNKEFISRGEADPATVIATYGSKTVHTYSFSTPTNAVYARLSCRLFGDTTAKVGFYLCPEYCDASPLPAFRPKAFSENGASFVEWYEEQNKVAPINNIKPHIGVRSINHRGWHECPENTLVAYKQSKVHGFEAGECDVRFTSDNVPVLLHDVSINRTARNSDGTELSSTINISSITYEQALEYDFGIYKSSDYAGTKIPTLAQYLALCRNIGLAPYIELKFSSSDEKNQIIVDTVLASGIADEVTFISNDEGHFPFIQEKIPFGRFGILPWTYSATYLNRAISLFNNKSEVFLDMDYTQITSDVVTACADKNVPIEAWTVNSTAILAADTYVSGFASDDAVASTVLYNSEISS